MRVAEDGAAARRSVWLAPLALERQAVGGAERDPGHGYGTMARPVARDNIRLAVSLNGYGVRRDDGTAEVLPWRDLLEIVATVEETGYETIFVPESGAWEAFATLAGFAAATRRVGLATGVLPTWSREPRRMAMGAATLQDVSGGRFTLGLGSLDTIEATRAYVEGVRRILAGGAIAGGDARPIDLVPEPSVPIHLAALGPRMTQLAGAVADGVILNWCTPERVAAAREQIARGAERAGRDPAGVTVVTFVRACLAHDEGHAAAALEAAAAQYAAMPTYARQFATMGLEDAPPRAIADAVTVRGERGPALERLGAYAEAGADVVAVYPVPAGEATSSITGTILACAPSPALEA